MKWENGVCKRERQKPFIPHQSSWADQLQERASVDVKCLEIGRSVSLCAHVLGKGLVNLQVTPARTQVTANEVLRGL